MHARMYAWPTACSLTALVTTCMDACAHVAFRTASSSLMRPVSSHCFSLPLLLLTATYCFFFSETCFSAARLTSHLSALDLDAHNASARWRAF